MTGAKDRAHVNIFVSQQTRDRVDDMAAQFDMSVTSVIEALVNGAAVLGVAQRAVMAGAASVTRAQRRPQPRQPWVNENPGTGGRYTPPTNVGRYRLHEFTLTRLGGSRSKTERAEAGNGWYLEGPGLPDPLFLGGHRGEAQRQAEAIIRRIKTEGADSTP